MTAKSNSSRRSMYGRDWTQQVSLERALHTLAGICTGISIDYEVTEEESTALLEWLQTYKGFLHISPFKDLELLLHKVLADGHLNEEEKEEVLDWCQRYASTDSPAVQCTTNALRRLHGVLHGIASDGRVTEQEIIDLRDWLEDYENLDDTWPFSELIALLKQVFADGQIDNKEIIEVTAFCEAFIQRSAGSVHDGPVLHTLTAVCNHGADIDFAGKSFCFTGKASRLRDELHAEVNLRGGTTSEIIKHGLNFLVVGKLSQPAWVYASYGRKIEKALALQRSGENLQIIHEDAFVAALQRQT